MEHRYIVAERRAYDHLQDLEEAAELAREEARQAERVYEAALKAVREERPWDIPGLDHRTVDALAEIGGWAGRVERGEDEA